LKYFELKIKSKGRHKTRIADDKLGSPATGVAVSSCIDPGRESSGVNGGDPYLIWQKHRTRDVSNPRPGKKEERWI
jgi:hypothetical protein